LTKQEGMSTEEMTCQELVELVTEYFEGTLPEAERRRFEDHLDECPWCVTYLEQIRQVVETLCGLGEESLPPRARDELLHAFRDWRRT
jgi:anti-sigma factor RsiW